MRWYPDYDHVQLKVSSPTKDEVAVEFTEYQKIISAPSYNRLTVREVAKRTGFSARTVYWWISTDRVKATREGFGRLRISESELWKVRKRPSKPEEDFF